MKKLLSALTIVSVSFFGMLSQANAFEPNFTVGIGYNEAVYAAEGREDNRAEDANTIVTSYSEYGAFNPGYGSVYLEVGNDLLSAGISWSSDFETPTNVNEGGFPNAATQSNSVKADFENYIQVYGMLNLPFGLFVKAGISEVDVVITESMISGNTYPDTSLDGVLVGAGINREISNGFGIRAEVVGHSFDDVEVNNGQTTTTNLNTVKISDMIGLSGMISLNKTF